MSTETCINHRPNHPDITVATANSRTYPRLDDRTAEVRQQAARLVHDLRSPLQGMLGATSLLRTSRTQPDDPTAERLLSIIEGSGKHMLKLLGELIDAASAHDGHFPVRPIRVDLWQVIREAVDIVEPLAAEKGIGLSFDISSAVPAVVTIDALRMKQVLVNLLANAIRFTDAGSVEVFADAADSTSIDTSTRCLCLEVRDTGIGIPENDLAGLMTSLTSGANSSLGYIRRGGSGLGLLTCQSILRSLSSSLAISSTPGRGTRAWFVLPA